MKNLSGVKAINNIADFRTTGLLNQTLLSTPFKVKKDSKKSELVSVRLSPELSETLDLLAFKFDNSRGIVARVLLEAAIFQLGGEHDVLSPEHKQAFDILMQKEAERNSGKK